MRIKTIIEWEAGDKCWYVTPHNTVIETEIESGPHAVKGNRTEFALKGWVHDVSASDIDPDIASVIKRLNDREMQLRKEVKELSVTIDALVSEQEKLGINGPC